MRFLKAEVDTRPGDAVEVVLEGDEANVMLLDRTNFSSYQNGHQFRYHGGYCPASPVVLRPPYAGHWYIVIDLGGYAGRVGAEVRVIR